MLLAVIAYPVDLRVHGHDHPSAHADESTWGNSCHLRPMDVLSSNPSGLL